MIGWAVAVTVFLLGLAAGSWAAGYAVKAREKRMMIRLLQGGAKRCHHATEEMLRKVDSLSQQVILMDAAVQSYLDFDCGESRITERLLRFTPKLCDLRVGLSSGEVFSLPEDVFLAVLALSQAIPDATAIIPSRDRQVWGRRMSDFNDLRGQCLDALLKQWFDDGKLEALTDQSFLSARNRALSRVRHYGTLAGINPTPSPPVSAKNSGPDHPDKPTDDFRRPAQ